jgi:uncharacterized protein
MPAIWAISDLHLSTNGAKPMDIFGDHWGNHAERMAERWDALVAPDDIVVTPGDFSWANKPAEVAGDFAWLAARPGSKIMVKGNHDYWWTGTHKRMAEILPPKTYALKKTAVIVHGVGFFGVRGGDFAPLTRYGDERTARITIIHSGLTKIRSRCWPAMRVKNLFISLSAHSAWTNREPFYSAD